MFNHFSLKENKCKKMSLKSEEKTGTEEYIEQVYNKTESAS